MNYVTTLQGKPPALPEGAALRHHIACPTTCGTGSEVTAIAIFDLLEAKAKTGIATRAIRPSMAIVDPLVRCPNPNPKPNSVTL
jgi:alcohol dehydrogenase class IV